MQWAVTAVASGSERKAIADLMGAGFDVYSPIVEAPVKVVRGKLTEPWEPAFPGYMFVRADQGRAIPCDGRVIGTVPEDVIDELRRREGPGGIIRLGLSKSQRRRLRAGQQVRGSAGSLLSGLHGIVKSTTDGHGRIVALFRLLGQQVPVTLCETMLTVA